MSETDHDLLLRIDERTKTLVIQLSNHLKHSFKYNLMAWGVCLTALTGIIILIVVKM